MLLEFFFDFGPVEVFGGDVPQIELQVAFGSRGSGVGFVMTVETGLVDGGFDGAVINSFENFFVYLKNKKESKNLLKFLNF